MKVSITIVAYNQENTIAQAIESVLHQKGDYDYEIVIGEDCSTDSTLQICKFYADKYPEIIRLLPNDHNLGILANFARTILACRGEYITGCSGDDYWCDDYKIQKQLDFLESHPDYGVVTTNIWQMYTKTGKLVQGGVPRMISQDGNIKSFYFSPQYSGGVYIIPLSQMFRSSLLKYIDFREMIHRKLPVEDYPMQAIWSQYTKFGHIQDVTCVYRIHGDSATFVSMDNPHYLEYHKGLSETRRYLNELFPDDTCFTEEQLQEYLFYREFLLYMHQRDYKKAKQLITDAPEGIREGTKFYQAKRFTKTWLHFMVAHFIKEYKYKQKFNQRT